MREREGENVEGRRKGQSNIIIIMVIISVLQVLLRTLQSTNSTRYRHLIEELFAQEGSRASEFSFFVNAQESKRSSLKVTPLSVNH